jgi:hypothetical protein
MAKTLKLSLTDELCAFVESNSGNNTQFATPEEFVLDVLRQEMFRGHASAMREAILEGYADAIARRTVRFEGNLRSLLRNVGK